MTIRQQFALWTVLFAMIIGGGVGCGSSSAEQSFANPPAAGSTVPAAPRHPQGPSPETVSGVLPALPNDADLYVARVFAEPLVPVGGEGAQVERAELGRLANAWREVGDAARTEGFEHFLEAYPQSVWRASLLLNLGLVYRETGRYGRALVAWEAAWNAAKADPTPAGVAVAERAVAELAEFNARLGRMDQLHAIFRELRGRPLHGSNVNHLQDAWTGLSTMHEHPERAFLCGPLALSRVRAAQHLEPFPVELRAAESTTRGTSLSAVWRLSQRLRMSLQMAFRSPGAQVLSPAVVNWKVGHFAALTRSEQVPSRAAVHRLEDPTFEDDVWIGTAALDEEASGYMLVPSGELPAGWRSVSEAEGEGVWGRGYTTASQRGFFGLGDLLTEACRASAGMARYGFHALLASLHVEDTPIWVNSPFGPAISLRAAYNQADFTQSSLPRMSGLGPKWSFTFRQFITEEVVSDGAQPQFYKLHVGAGGVLDYRFSGSATASQAELTDRSVLTRVVPGGTTLPTTFRRALSDGSIEEYDRVVSTMPGRTFALTRVVDPHGNAITLYYDDYLRLTFVTDARGEGLSFYYDPSALADSAAFYQIVRVETTPTSPTQVADFGYTSGRLTSIRDMAGMVSSFLYRSEARGLDHPAPPENVASPPDPDPDFLYRMTTPYGDTNFSTGWVPDGGSNPYSYNRRWVEATDPAGQTERIEYRHFSATCGGDAECNANPDMFRAVDPDHAPAALTDLFGTTINTNLGWRNSLYWDSRSWVRARAIDVNFGGGAWRLARVIHWMHRSHAIDQATGVIATVQEPGQYRTWYAYLNQEYAFYLGDDGTALPSTIARFVPSGSSTQEQVTRYTWNSLGHVATVTDPQNRQMAFAYDSNGIDPLFVDHRTSTSPVQYQRVSAYSNFVRHRPTSVTDAAGQTTVYQYNCRGQVLSRMRPGGAVTTYTYDSPSSNANPPCSGTEGRLVSVSGPGGTVSLSTYTNRNLPRVVTDLNGLAKTYTFDALDRVTRVDLPDGSHNAVTYVQRDDQGQPRLDAGVPVPGLEPTQFTDRGGQITTRSYDRAQRLIYNNDPNGHVTRYNYCCGSGLSSISDSLAHQTTWVRDDTLSGRLDNRPVKMIRADGTTVAYEYDRAGRLSAETNGQLDGDPSEPGYRAVYEYNLDATVGNVEVSAGGETYGRVYGYDPFFQRLTSVFHTQNTGGTYSASFDFSLTYRALGASGAGQVEQIQGVLPNSTIVYGYDALGRRVSRTMGNTQWAVRLDAADRLDHVDHTVGGATRTLDYHYPVGSALAHPNSVDYPVILGTTQRAHSTFGYYGTDQFRRLQAYSHVDRDGATLENSSLEYTVPGRISWKLFDGAWTNYTYDPAGQLTDFVRWEDNGQAWEYRDWAHYGYDPQGNRDVATVFAPWHSSGTFSWYTNYDWGDRPYHRSDSDNYGVALVPDHRGNVADDGIFIYQWNHFGQLKSVNVWGQITSFAYDGVGRLASWTTGAVTHYFVWDGQQLVQERDSTTNVLREVFPEGFGQGGHRLYYLRDQLGSVIGLLDETGHRVRSYRYDPWGGRSSTFVAPGFEAYDSPIGFAGYLVHPDSGLHFTPTRVYAPNIGRWLSRDPLGHRDAVDGRNLYAYAANDPVNGRDSTGQYLDTLIDAGFIAYDVSNIVGDFASGNCGSINGHLGDLGLDVLGAAIPGVTGLGAARRVGSGAEHVLGHLGRGGDDLVDVYRGVSAGHPNPRVWREAQQGAARPIGGRGAHSDPARHASGRTHSTFVSWSTDPQVALDFATHSGTSEGVILHDTLPRSVVEQLMNPSGIPGERELLRGSSSGATVWRVNPGDYGL